jgi:hypothetical protein
LRAIILLSSFVVGAHRISFNLFAKLIFSSICATFIPETTSNGLGNPAMASTAGIAGVLAVAGAAGIAALAGIHSSTYFLNTDSFKFKSVSILETATSVTSKKSGLSLKVAVTKVLMFQIWTSRLAELLTN